MKPLSVYVHIPFCIVKCGYCDFNAYAGMDALKPRYRDAVLKELDASAPLLQGAEVVSIGFGGGTPGEMSPADIARIVDRVGSLGSVQSSAEVSLEANPGTSSGLHFAALRAAGVTRLSLGAQSFNPDNLRFLDRVHSVEAIGASVRGARSAGFDSINIDLIYGLPGQDAAAWRADVAAAIALDTDHLSLYCLTVEEGTRLHRQVNAGDVSLPSADAAADMYELASEVLEAAGYEQYELSNWARRGYRSVHNLGYWTGRDYVGVGAGAHGFVDGVRYENIAHPRAYIDAAFKGELPRADAYRPAGATAMSDWLAMRLRLVDGFALDDFTAAFGVALADVAGSVVDAAARAGILDVSGTGIARLTKRGRLLHGELCALLLRRLEDAASVR